MRTKRNRQKIKRYNFSVMQKSRRKKTGKATPLRAAGMVLCSMLIIVLFSFGVMATARTLKYSVPGWHGSARGRYFISSQTGEMLKGLYQIEDSIYYFSDNGYVQTGWIQQDDCYGYANLKGQLARGEQEIDGVAYNFQEDNGQLYKGWKTIDGTPYCFDDHGFPLSGLYEEDGVEWYLNEDGSAAEGYFKASDGNEYYFSKAGRAADAFASIDNKRYYFDSNGDIVTGWYKTTDGWYLFDENGVQQTGWQETDDGVSYYYLSTGEMVRGWQNVDGAVRYFNEDGSLGQGFEQINGKYYSFSDGVSQTGWASSGSKQYYLDGNGNFLSGWCVIDEKPYAFESTGALKQGWDRSNDKVYYFIDGVSQSGVISDGLNQYSLNGCGDLNGSVGSTSETIIADQATEGEGAAVTEEAAASSQQEQAPQTISFSSTLTLNGKGMTMGQSLATQDDFPGQPVSSGDTSAVFTYDGFVLYGSSSAKLSGIDLTSSACATAEGATVGMTEAQVAAIYGASYQKNGSTMVYRGSNGVRLSFELNGAGSVQKISYRS